MFKKLTLKKLKEEGLSPSQAKKWYYAYKSYYIATWIADMITDYWFQVIQLSIFGLYFGIWALVFGSNQETIKSIICTLIAVTLLIFDLCTIHSVNRFNKMNESDKEKQIEKNTKKRDEIAEKIENLCLLNNRVISRKMWRKIKKISPQSYKMLRSEQLKRQCYITTWYMLDKVQDKDLKLMWVLNTNHAKNYKYGHALIRKGNYIYCPNERRTYSAKKYINAFETKVFKEMSLSEYQMRKCPSDITVWIDTPKKVVITKQMVDNFEELADFCKQNGGHRSPEDETD